MKKYDVALYMWGKDYVLHRVMRMKADHCLIRRDNTYAVENVSDEAVIGVLTGFQRKVRSHEVTEWGYRLYARAWQAAYPLRALWRRCRRWIGRRIHS